MKRNNTVTDQVEALLRGADIRTPLIDKSGDAARGKLSKVEERNVYEGGEPARAGPGASRASAHDEEIINNTDRSIDFE